MNQSETIGELAKALAKVQASVPAAKMDKTNPFFKSKYADLNAIWTACRSVLAANNLAVVQTGIPVNSGNIGIATTLIHSSGEWIRGEMILPVTKERDPQACGSAITYARRYSLASIVGLVSDEDDDAEGAVKRETIKPPQKQTIPEQGEANLDYGFLKKMKGLKKDIGDEAYYEITKNRKATNITTKEYSAILMALTKKAILTKLQDIGLSDIQVKQFVGQNRIGKEHAPTLAHVETVYNDIENLTAEYNV